MWMSRGMALAPCISLLRLSNVQCRIPIRGFNESRRDGVHKMFLGPLVFHNKRHRRQDKRLLARTPYKAPDIEIHRYGTRREGVQQPRGFQPFRQMQAQLVVPADLDKCELRPYVSYRCKQIDQEELTPKDLFNAVYGAKIVRDFRNGKLDEQGNSVEPSNEEMLDEKEARRRARKTGSDIFLGGTERSRLWRVRWEY